MVINLKTSKALGLSVPLGMQQRADEVIDEIRMSAFGSMRKISGHWWGHLRSKSFKGGLLVLRIHGREVIWLNPTARVGGKDARLGPKADIAR